MQTKKIISIFILVLASTISKAQFPANSHGGLIGFSGNFGNFFLNENEYDQNSNSFYINVNPGITCYKSGDKSVSTGMNLNYSRQFYKSKSESDTSFSRNSGMGVGVFRDCDKWVNLTSGNQFYFVTGCDYSAGASTRISKNFRDTLLGTNTTMQYQLGFNFHIGISYIRSSRWVWNLRYVPFAASINYSHEKTNISNRPNASINAGTSFFYSGVGFSMVYLFGGKQPESR